VPTALFPGSFDPFHLGHLAIVEWAASRYDEVVVAVLGNPDKPAGMFKPAERVRLATLATEHLANVRCLAAQGLTGTLAKEQHADVIIRSAHKERDLERSLAVLNKFFSGGIPTEFAPSDPALESISSSTVRELLASGDIEAAVALVPATMRAELPTAERLDEAALYRGTPARPGALTVGRRVELLRVAAVQDAPVFMDRDATLDKALTLIERAADGGAQLVVFPEAFIPGYPDWVWRTRPSDDNARALYGVLFDNAVVLGSAVTQVLGLAAQRHGVYLSIGINEREAAGSTLYATQLLFGPDASLLSVHRQLVPSGAEQLVWGTGDGSGLSVIETPFGRIGTLVSSENYMPLARAALYAQGVDIYLAPTWDNSQVWPSTMQHIAKEGSVFVVGVNHRLQASQIPDSLPGRHELYGDEHEWLARGDTQIVDPTGHVLAGPLPDEAGTVVGVIDVNTARHLRHRFDPTGRHHRPDVFQLHVDSSPRSSPAEGGDKGASAPGQVARGGAAVRPTP
jgi:nitrilase